MRLGGGWMLVAHWVACVWFAIGVGEYDRQALSDTVLAYSSWMTRVAPIGRAVAADSEFSAFAYSTCIRLCRETVAPDPNTPGLQYPEFVQAHLPSNSSVKRLECISGLRFPVMAADGHQRTDAAGAPLWAWCDSNNFCPQPPLTHPYAPT